MAAWFTRTGNTLIQWGWVVKNQVDLPISFPTAFGSIPAVVVTSEWSNAGVGYVETIFNVTWSGFRVHSGNRATNYYVNWTAIGLAPGVTPLAREMEDAVSAFQQLDRVGEASATKESYDQGAGQTKESEVGKP